jgi:hypothetical protein
MKRRNATKESEILSDSLYKNSLQEIERKKMADEEK